MKNHLPKILSFSLISSAILALSGCYYVDPVGVHPPHSGGHGGHGHNQYAYKQGASYGRQDARQGKSMQPSRYWHRIRSEDRYSFSQGYNDAYQQANSGHHGGDHGNNRYAYKQGAGYGRQDALQGKTMQPSRYWHLIPASSRIPFSQGYNDSYQRTR